jgi:hypothetical protein
LSLLYIGEANSAAEFPQEARKRNPICNQVATAARILDRVRARVAFASSGCWMWQGATNSKGYPAMRIGGRAGKTMSVHRLVAAEVYGAIPAGMLVCHTCDVPACVNPAHLYIGTALDNMRDKIERGRAVNVLATRNASKTHCPNGHPYSTENTLVLKDGERRCRTCQLINNRRRRASQRAERGAAA